MSSGDAKPFDGLRAFDKASLSYVPFQTHADAMLASLQLFHDVPCQIMNLIIAMVAHPDFDSKCITLRSSRDVIQVVEEARLRERTSVVQKRSLNAEGHMEHFQTKFPQIILHEVLDVIHTQRQAIIKAAFDEELVGFDDCDEVELLSNMSLVHRSWTLASQKALGRILHFHEHIGDLDYLSGITYNNVFGPWTSVVAVVFLRPNRHSFAYDKMDRNRQRFETLHRFLLRFSHLKRIYFQSHSALATTWSDFTVGEMIRQNACLEELTLHAKHDEDYPAMASFKLDPLTEDECTSNNLQLLSVRGAQFSIKARKKVLRGEMFANLRSLHVEDIYFRDGNSSVLALLLSTLSSGYHGTRLESISITDAYPGNFDRMVTETTFTPRQCAIMFQHLCTLRVSSPEADRWIKWITPDCTHLKHVTLRTKFSSPPGILSSIPTTIQSLTIQLCEPTKERIRDFTLNDEWAVVLLELPSSGRVPGLKSLALSFPHSEREVRRRTLQEEIQNYMATMQTFVDQMSDICEGVGISFSYQMEERKYKLDVGH